MKIIRSILLILVVFVGNIHTALDDNTFEQMMLTMGECYKLAKILDILPSAITDNVDPACSSCKKKTSAGYFAGMLSARNYSEKAAILRDLVRKTKLTACELRRFFVEIANEMQEQCRSCAAGHQWE